MNGAMSLTYLADVKPFKSSWQVQVKVLNTWKQYSKQSGETLEMVLADQRGSKIHASIKKGLVTKFDRLITKGDWRVIESFSLTQVRGQFRVTNHPLKIGFMNTTSVTPCNKISAAIRRDGNIVLNVASSGIASLLLPGGRTAHSRFGIPLNPDDFTTFTMKPNTDLGNLVKETSLIIWDEAPMMSKYCFKSLDKSLQDVAGNGNGNIFGGKVVIFGGDFRLVLPVIAAGSRTEIVLASLISSYIWSSCQVMKLTKNMRLF